MRMTIPRVESAQDLAARAREQPGLVVITQTKNEVSPGPLPDGYQRALEVVISGQKFEAYRAQ